MSIEISVETEARLTEEARRQGVSLDVLLDRLLSELGATAHTTGTGTGTNPRTANFASRTDGRPAPAGQR